MFIYLNGGVWVHRAYLPTRYRDYDLYSGYKVVMTDYRGTRPYSNYNVYRTRYAKGYRGQEQRSIGQRPGKGNVNHQGMQKNENAGHGNSKDQGKGNDKNQGRGNGKNK